MVRKVASIRFQANQSVRFESILLRTGSVSSAFELKKSKTFEIKLIEAKTICLVGLFTEK